MLTSKGSERTHSLTLTILQGQKTTKQKPKQNNVLLTFARHFGSGIFNEKTGDNRVESIPGIYTLYGIYP